MVETVYLSLIFILSLFIIGRLLSGQYDMEGIEPAVRNNFVNACIGLVIMCLLTVCTGVTRSTFLNTVLLYIIEFVRMGIFIYGTEFCANITNKNISRKSSVYAVSAELFYFGILSIVITGILDGCEIKNGIFGIQFVRGHNVGMIVYIVFHVVVLFFYSAYTYMYYYSCSKKRERYIYKRCVVVVGIISACMFVEGFCLLRVNEYIPVMTFGLAICMYIFEKLLLYRRRIEYNEDDYEKILSPSFEQPAFVCDDEGVIIFENTRAFVMRQMFKDNYMGNYLSDVFEFSQYDLDRLRDARIKEPFEVYCKYRMEQREVKLSVRHNLDRYQEIFSTEVEVTLIDEVMPAQAAAGVKSPDVSSPADRYVFVNLTHEQQNAMRVEALIEMLEQQNKLYMQKDSVSFECNLKGINRLSKSLNMMELSELCERLFDDLERDESWDNLNAGMIELDRQFETLKFFN